MERRDDTAEAGGGVEGESSTRSMTSSLPLLVGVGLEAFFELLALRGLFAEEGASLSERLVLLLVDLGAGGGMLLSFLPPRGDAPFWAREVTFGAG